MRSKIGCDLAVAYVSGNREFITALDPVPDELALGVQALRCGLDIGRGDTTHAELVAAIQRALSSPLDAHLGLVLRRVYLTLLAYEGQLEAAWQQLAALEAIHLPDAPVELATIPHIARWRLQRLAGDDMAAIASLDSFPLHRVEPGSRVWCDIHISRYQSCLETWDFRGAHDVPARLMGRVLISLPTAWPHGHSWVWPSPSNPPTTRRPAPPSVNYSIPIAAPIQG